MGAVDARPEVRIAVRDLSKWYGDVVALSGVGFDIGPGTTTVLGPNGAGKSTLLRLLVGLARPSGGTVSVFGGDPRRDASLFARIGFVPEDDALFHAFDAATHVAELGRARGVTGSRGAARAVLERLGLDADDDRPIATYSRGMRQRVKLASALVHDPDVLVCDEPLSGLDPEQRERTITLLRQLGEDGRCVLVSTHVLAEAARIGARVLVLVDGQLAADGDYRAIRDLMDDRPRRLRLGVEPARPLAASLLDAGLVDTVEIVDDTTLLVATRTALELGRRVAAIARDAGVRLRELVPIDEDLDSVFRYLMRRSPR